MDSSTISGGLEAGGTKFVCAVGSDPDNIVKETRLETTTPAETLGKVIKFFQPFADSGEITELGIGCFGPLDLDPDSPSFGFITATPKPGWSNTDVAGALAHALHLKVSIDLDVNAAALGEFRWGASQGIDSSLYLTVGTGIGGGYIKDGRSLLGMLHPEMGHIFVPHDLNADPFPGNCPFHGDCFEGLANGPAIERRFNLRGETIPDDDPFWEIEAGYIAAALSDYILVLSPKRIVLGGGIMQRGFLFPLIRKKVLENLNGYVRSKTLLEDIEHYIVPPGLGGRSGVLGAIALASKS